MADEGQCPVRDGRGGLRNNHRTWWRRKETRGAESRAQIGVRPGRPSTPLSLCALRVASEWEEKELRLALRVKFLFTYSCYPSASAT
jgi:hypothetical protein